MTVEKIYKTEDGKTFTTKEEALKHEDNIKLKNEKEINIKKELDNCRTLMDEKLDKAVEAYQVYSDAFIEYNKKLEEYRKICPDYKCKEDSLFDFVNSILSAFGIE